jgi:hypothetical protein
VKNIKLFALSALLTINTVGYAADPGDFGCIFTKPAACPTVDEIKAGKVGKGVILLKGEFFAGRRHLSYGTTNVWTFIMGPIPAPTKTDAYNTALSNLSSLHFLFGPQCSPLQNWICVYNTDVGIPSVAATPQLPTLQAGSSLL